MNTILRIIVAAVAVWIVAYILPGFVAINDFWTAIVVVIVLSIVNGVIGTILRILTFPLNILSLGLVSFIIGVLMILLTSSLVDGFVVNGVWGAIIFSIVLSLVNILFGVDENIAK